MSAVNIQLEGILNPSILRHMSAQCAEDNCSSVKVGRDKCDKQAGPKLPQFYFLLLEPSSSEAAKEEGAMAKPKTPRTPNAFALFVKENYGVIKSSRADLPHAAVMKLLSAKFAESKLKLI